MYVLYPPSPLLPQVQWRRCRVYLSMSMSMSLHPALPSTRTRREFSQNCTVLYCTAEAGIQNPLPVSSTRVLPYILLSGQWQVANKPNALPSAPVTRRRRDNGMLVDMPLGHRTYVGGVAGGRRIFKRRA